MSCGYLCGSGGGSTIRGLAINGFASSGIQIAGLGATGQTRVTRRPAGLYTPEGWEVGLTATDPVVEIAIRRAIREGVFAA